MTTETKATHTPGPWASPTWPASHNYRHGDAAQDRIVPSPVTVAGQPQGDCIAVAYGCTIAEAEANARHIARCVNNHDNLLAACKFARREIASFLGCCSEDEIADSFGSFAEAVEAFDAAIARAKGGAS